MEIVDDNIGIKITEVLDNSCGMNQALKVDLVNSCNSECDNNSSSEVQSTEEKKKNFKNGYGWGLLGVIIIFFIVIFIILWIIFYSLKPSFVVDENTGEANTGKVLLAAIIGAIIITLICGLIYFTVC